MINKYSPKNEIDPNDYDDPLKIEKLILNKDNKPTVEWINESIGPGFYSVIDWYGCYFDHKNKIIFWNKSPNILWIRFDLKLYDGSDPIKEIDDDIKTFKVDNINFEYKYYYETIPPYKAPEQKTTDTEFVNLPDYDELVEDSEMFRLNTLLTRYKNELDYDTSEIKIFFKTLRNDLKCKIIDDIDEINNWLFYNHQISHSIDEGYKRSDPFKFGLKFDISNGEQIEQ